MFGHPAIVMVGRASASFYESCALSIGASGMAAAAAPRGGALHAAAPAAAAAAAGSVVFEACVDSVASAVAAVAGGASRLELCEALVEGGVTPSIGKIRAVCSALRAATAATPPVLHVLVRPRGGDFLYDAVERDVMLHDIAACRATDGVAGVVVGALTADGSVDVEFMAACIGAARPLAVTFHRAIDAARDCDAAWAAVAALGVEYVLTSGGAARAIDGVDVLRRFVAASAAHGGRPIVIAAGGVTPAVAGALVAATGVRQLHATARVSVPSGMTHRPAAVVYMGGEKTNTPEAEYSHKVADAGTVAAILAAAAGTERSS